MNTAKVKATAGMFKTAVEAEVEETGFGEDEETEETGVEEDESESKLGSTQAVLTGISQN